MLLFASLFALLQGAAPPAGAGAPAITPPRIDAPVAVDGRLDEPAWAEAARLADFSQYEPVDGRPAEEWTEVRVWYAPDAIHFGIIARDRQPGAIRATVADRDNIDNDDHVVLYLDTFNDQRRAFFFAVNPFGVQQDGVRTEGATTPGRIFGGSIDRNPDYYFESKGSLTGDGYVVEVRIPFKSLRFPGSGLQRWGLQVERKVQRTGHSYTWTDARRASASFLAQAGTIEGLHDLERGVVLEAQPFLTAAANGERLLPGERFSREPLDPEIGANLRLGLAHLSLDATFNPDFSQVEADVGQLTANERFALFFPEKRPFFLEGIELFATPNQLVHTRQINDPLVGGKITGKIGGIGIAHLTALDERRLDGAGEALFNITRLRRDFGTSSLAGVTLTDRSVQGGGHYNRVLAGDVRHVFGGLYFVEAQLGGSWTRDERGERSAPIWKLEADRTGRQWGFNYQLNGIGESFESRAGYVPRSGIVSGHAVNRLSYYGRSGAALERITLFLRPARLWREGDFGSAGASEGSESLNATFRMRGGWEIEAGARRDFYHLEAPEYAHFETETDGVREPYRPLDQVSGPVFELGGNTPAYQRFDANANIARGRVPIFAEGSEGTASGLRGELSLRPNGSVRLSFSTTYERITRERDGSEFARTILPRLKAELQPTRALFFRAVGEYRSERRAALADARTGAPLLVAGQPVPALRLDGLRIDLLASFQPTPGTVAFLGYGSSLDMDDAFDFGRLERSTDGFFLKLAYQFRR